MILQVGGTTAILVVASVVVGRALALLGAGSTAAAPAVGMATLVTLAGLLIKLPGRAATAAIILLVIVLAALAVVVWRGGRPRTSVLVPALVVLVTLAGAAIPFIANGRLGLPGVSLDNDTAAHLVWAEALRSPAVAQRYGFNQGYPLGPHSLVAVLGTGLGARLDLVLTGLLVATLVVIALVACTALAGGWRRLVVGVLPALFYLVAVYYAEGAFKEPLMGLFLLAMVLDLEDVRRGWAAVGVRSRWVRLVGVALLWAGAVWVYSYLGLAWMGGTLVLWLLAEGVAAVVVSRPPGRWPWPRARGGPAPRPRWRDRLGRFAPTVLVAIAVLIVAIAPTAARVLSYVNSLGLSPAGTGGIAVSNIGNLVHALPGYEALGIWNNADFRFAPVNVFHQGELSGLAVALLVWGLLVAVVRRDLVLPAAVVVCGLIYWRSSHGQSPYVTAKALVIAGPVVCVACLRGVLGPMPEPGVRWGVWARVAVAAAFVFFAGRSTFQALRNMPVWTTESTRELISLDSVTRNQSVLFLGNSDFAPWLFHDSNMSALASSTVSMALAAARPNKRFIYGTALDFDSVDPSTINRFTWVITTTTDYASQPPPQFELVRRLPMYELWRRVAPVPPREVLERSGEPGAVLNCRTPAGRALSRRFGVAAVMARPVIANLTAIAPGGAQTVTLHLAPGAWQLSIQYLSPVGLRVSAPSDVWQVPPYVDRPGPIFAVGSLTSTGAPIPVTVTADRPSTLTGPNLAALTTALVAVRLPDVRTVIPLRRACGRYVDWYRL